MSSVSSICNPGQDSVMCKTSDYVEYTKELSNRIVRVSLLGEVTVVKTKHRAFDQSSASPVNDSSESYSFHHRNINSSHTFYLGNGWSYYCPSGISPRYLLASAMHSAQCINLSPQFGIEEVIDSMYSRIQVLIYSHGNGAETQLFPALRHSTFDEHKCISASKNTLLYILQMIDADEAPWSPLLLRRVA
jgi:hypothetical protein